MKQTELSNRIATYVAILRDAVPVGPDRAGNWRVYAAVTGSALAMASNASASIIYSGNINVSKSVSSVGLPGVGGPAGSHTHSNSASVKLKNAVGDTIGVSFGIFIKQRLQSHSLHGTLGLGTKNVNGGFLFSVGQGIKHLSAGATIKSPVTGSNFQGSTNLLFGHAVSAAGHVSSLGAAGWGAKNGYIGFDFKNGETTDYGWIKLSFTTTENGAAGSFNIESYAYDDSGAAIQAGAGTPTPEPGTSSLALLAIGAAGITALRRRKSV